MLTSVTKRHFVSKKSLFSWVSVSYSEVSEAGGI